MKRFIKLAAVYIIYFICITALIYLLYAFNRPHEADNAAYSDSSYTDRSLNNDGRYAILTFDDGWSSQYEAFKLLKPFKGTLYIISSLIGKEDRLSLDNLKEMYKSGWDISNHTVHHNNLTEVSLEKAYDEVYGCSAWIKGHGFTRNTGYKHFAYPEGGNNPDIIGILQKQGILTARTTNPGNDTSSYLQLGRTSLSGMSKENIRIKIFSDEKLLILNFHRIVPDDTATLSDIDLKQSYFNEVINSINESGREVLTISEWYKMARNTEQR